MEKANNIFEKLDESTNPEINDNSESVEIKTGIDPSFFAETMTADVELVDAIFDLIDNSIDAARNQIIDKGRYSKDEYGLPNDYSQYEIMISLSSDFIKIADNCFGIDNNSIENKAFYTGKKSSHKYGIGFYGLGLKRALLKAGERFSILSDNGQNLYFANFSYKNLSGDKDHILKAEKYPSKNSYGTIFTVKSLKKEVIEQISNLDWFKSLIAYMSIRYSIFLDKGLKLSVNNEAIDENNFIKIESKLPRIKEDGLIPKAKLKKDLENVTVYFDVGIHDKYRFPAEQGSNPKENGKITDEYGIYIICNDRVIVSSSFEKKYGFKTAFHSEYNGFLCYVRMIAENPAFLPWNTTKTEIKVYSDLFTQAKKPIESLALDYRSNAKVIIKTWLSEDIKNLPEEERRKAFYDKLNLDIEPKNDSKKINHNQDDLFGERNLESQNNQNPDGSTGSKPKPSKDSETKQSRKHTKPRPKPNENLDRDRNIFINWNNCSIDIPRERKKEYEILADMCKLSSKETPIACMVMLRVFLETTVKQVIISMDLDWQNLRKSTKRVVEGLRRKNYVDDSIKELITQFTSTEGDLFSVNNIQSMVHSTKFHPDKSSINAYWDNLEPFLAACWKFVTDSDND